MAAVLRVELGVNFMQLIIPDPGFRGADWRKLPTCGRFEKLLLGVR